jgi:cytochrome c553
MRLLKVSLIVLPLLLLWCTQSLAEAKEEIKPIDITRAVKRCKVCHGKDLRGKKKSPSLYNKDFSEVYVSLTSSVPKKMKGVVKKLSEQEVWEVSRFISELGDTDTKDQD